MEESLGALVELREEGKIRRIGVCNVSVAELEQARATTPIASVQDRFDVRTRDNEPVLDACARLGVAFLPWSRPGTARRRRRDRRWRRSPGATLRSRPKSAWPGCSHGRR